MASRTKKKNGVNERSAVSARRTSAGSKQARPPPRSKQKTHGPRAPRAGSWAGDLENDHDHDGRYPDREGDRGDGLLIDRNPDWRHG
ncbi:MAG: hypothetical protein QM723_24940 [Myxococcaceae bacterium]